MPSLITNFDNFVNALIASHTFPALRTAATIISDIADVKIVIILSCILALYLSYRGRWHEVVILISSIALTGGAVFFLKDIFMRARPENALEIIMNDPSFPSGHASMSAAFFVAIGFVFVSRIYSSAERKWLTAVCIVAPIAVGLSRLVLNVHWASDVIAGWLIGASCALISISIIRRLTKKPA